MKILVTGASGQVGSELVTALARKYGRDSVLACDIRRMPDSDIQFEEADVRDRDGLGKIIRDNGVQKIFHLAALLSASGEKNPTLAFDVNLLGTWNVLTTARDQGVKQVIIPSTIGVFGPDTPKKNVPPTTIVRPRTMYGITKYAAELLGDYFSSKFSLDCRGLRFPGLISYLSPPGGGTTDYSIEMIVAAAHQEPYECFLREDTRLPMMYMQDAISSLIDLSEADSSRLKRRTDYHVSSFSFTPKELEEELHRHFPSFRVTYRPDFRQEIADQWPESLDYSAASADWGFKPRFDFRHMVSDMISHLARPKVI